MKAIVCHSYGGFEQLRPEEVETPTPGEDEVLIRVRAASVLAATGTAHSSDTGSVSQSSLGTAQPSSAERMGRGR